MGYPRPLFVCYWSFQTKALILHQKNVKIIYLDFSPGIRTLDSLNMSLPL